MENYHKKLTLLDEPKDRGFFPENFSNEIYYSNLDSFSYISYRSNFSIKFIVKGEETYLIDGKKSTVKAGQYLLVNDGRIIETTPECNSEAISVFLNKDLMAEVLQNHTESEETLLETFDTQLSPAPEFFENRFSQKDRLGNHMQKLYKQIVSTSSPNLDFSKETYYELAEQLVFSQTRVQKEINMIGKVKKSTREELYRRVLIARDFIIDTATQPFDFDILCLHCGLSKYHLIRIFKEVFQLTPYQFHIRCKIVLAKEILKNDDCSLTDVAYYAGFNDIFSFSKAFKNVTGINPSIYRQYT